MPSRACVEITGMGNRVAAVDWNCGSYSMSQITSSRRPTRTVAIQANKEAALICISSLKFRERTKTHKWRRGRRCL